MHFLGSSLCETDYFGLTLGTRFLIYEKYIYRNLCSLTYFGILMVEPGIPLNVDKRKFNDCQVVGLIFQ